MAKEHTTADALIPCLIFSVLGYFVFSRTGDDVKLADLAFSFGFPAYIAIANVVSFDSNKLQISQREKNNIPFEPMGKHSLGKGKFITETSFKIYFAVSKIMGFLIPLILTFTGPSDVALMVTPSLIIVCAQAVAEHATFTFHDVLRILVPIGFSSYRLFGPLMSWANDSHSLYLEKESSGEFVYTLNFALALANLVFAAWNLFGFLLLRALPLYFDKEETPTPEFAYTLLPLPKKENKKDL